MTIATRARRNPSLVTAAGGGRRITTTVDALRRASHGRIGVETVDADLRSEPLARSLTDHVRGTPAAIVALEALGGGPPGGALFDDAAETVLTTSTRPVLVLGPNARAVDGPPTRLVVVVDGASVLGPLVHAVGDLTNALDDVGVTVAELSAPDPWTTADEHDPALDRVRSFARTIGAEHRTVVTDVDPHAALRHAATLVPGSILVVAARRWPDPGEHWYRYARRLIRLAVTPVLVVPDDLDDGWSDHATVATAP